MADSKMVDDLATLSVLNEKTILEQLKNRYHKDLIYTYIGDILLAVNPYRSLPIYKYEESTKYVNLKYRRTVRPHVFAIADKAYQQMKRTGVNQCCVISGESGTGKTESAKFIVQHIMNHCHSHQRGLQDKILQVNPLLEAFGNAKTVMNNNSSRFGKFIEIKFTTDGKVVGASIDDYLLEKSRVVFQNQGERNFHIFYYMFAGLTEDERYRYYLAEPEKHRILNSNHSVKEVFNSDRDYQHCQSKFDELKKLLLTVGFSHEDIDIMLTVLAAIVNLADTEFELDYDLDGAFVGDEYYLKVVATLLSVDPVDLAAALISTTTFAKGERIVMLKSVEQANDGRDALAKALYARLFGWIVGQVNDMLAPRDEYSNESRCSIGILDIFGFENFSHNSFEQLCINFTNEQLQYFFNQNIFAWEQLEYANEGISMKEVKFNNNRGLLQLFMERPIGIFALLDEESKFPQATDDTLVHKFNDRLSRHPSYTATSGVYRGAVFGIRHFAGEVVYNAVGFLEKNRDSLNQNLTGCLKNSENPFINKLFRAKISSTGSIHRRNDGRSKDRKAILLCPSRPQRQSGDQQKQKVSATKKSDNKNQQTTLSSCFKESLTDLMEKVLAAEPQFIRCIKPNHQKQGRRYEDKVVLDQLRCTGVLQTTSIRRLGYAVRLPFEDFMNRYKFLCFPLTAKVQLNAVNCYHLLESTGLTDWQVGKTKVFLKYWHSEQLDSLMDSHVANVVTSQKCIRGWLARRRMRHLRKQLLLVMSEFLTNVQESGEKVFEAVVETHQHNVKKKGKVGKAKTPVKTAAVVKRTSPAKEVTTTTPTITTTTTTTNNNEAFDPSELQKFILADTMSVVPSLDPRVWCRLYLLEKTKAIDAFSIGSPTVVVDGSSRQQRGRIGFQSLSYSNEDSQSQRIRTFIGKGVQLEMDSEGHVWATRLTKNDVFVRGWTRPQYCCVSAEVIKNGGRLLYGEAMKVFDMNEFIVHVAMEEERSGSHDFIRHLCITSLSFIKNSEDDKKTPCWISIAVLPALRQRMSDPTVLDEIREIRNEYRTAKEIKEEAERLSKKRRWAKMNTRSSNFEKGERKAGRLVRLEEREKAIAEGLPWKYSWVKSDDEESDKTPDTSDVQSESDQSTAESSYYVSDVSSRYRQQGGADIRTATLKRLEQTDPGLRRRQSRHHYAPEPVTDEKLYTSNVSGMKIEKRRQWAKVREFIRQDEEKEITQE
ncbi:myosin-IIIa-like [Glandiceps talaboti]